MRLNPRGY